MKKTSLKPSIKKATIHLSKAARSLKAAMLEYEKAEEANKALSGKAYDDLLEIGETASGLFKIIANVVYRVNEIHKLNLPRKHIPCCAVICFSETHNFQSEMK